MFRYLGLLCLGCVAACASVTNEPTPYQPRGFNGGYADRQIAEGVYRIRFHGNIHTPASLAREHWNRRARELCPYGYDQETDVRVTQVQQYIGPNYTGGTAYGTDLMVSIVGTATCHSAPAAGPAIR